MKGNVITICTTVLLIWSAVAAANTIGSSTMVFEGSLSQVGDAYTGIAPMVDEAGTAHGDGESGFDVYARNGAWATYDTLGSGSSDYAEGQIVEHDAYTTAGGWGSFYDPDCADWSNYQLRLTEAHWYLEYNGNVGNDGILTGAAAPPMSGPMDWSAMFASEEDTGAYYSGMGTAESPGYSSSFAASKGQSTAGAWDMDWSWGSDYVPLEHSGFHVVLTDLGGGNFRVTLIAAESGDIWVDDDFDGSTPGWGVTHFDNIQAGIDAAADGVIINVAAGLYDGTINLDGRSGISIIGADKQNTIVKSSSTLPFNVGGYGSSRTAVMRVVDSTDCALQNLTIDMDTVKANGVHAILFYDSTGLVDNNIIKNLSVSDVSGGYYEIGSDFRGPGFSDIARAVVTISNNTFIDTGRLGVVTHDYVDATITNNVFYKTTDDFGYAVEIGGPSIATVTDNKIYGFDTEALSDGSESAGIYIESAWTTGISGLTKNVLVQNNEVFECQYGMWIGNGYNGLGGDVDIVVTLEDNSIHDNVDGGAWIQDEDKENGSSVTVNGSGNAWLDNGLCGLNIYTNGDGDITVALSGDSFHGQDTAVYVVDDTGGTGSSSYSVAINDSSISGNSSYGVNNTVTGLVVDAEDNWWGQADGPGGDGPGTGDAVSSNVDYDPWLGADPLINILKLNVQSDPVFLQPGEYVVIDMDALNLAQHVFGCQAVLNFDSSYFLAGSGDVDVQPGGGVWNELIYSVWNTGGDLDVAVGVDLTSAVGTKSDGTVAKYTLTADSAASDGTTQMVFRSDGDDTSSTFFSDALAQPVYPGSKIDSQDIVIDGTDPQAFTVTADPLCTATTTTLTFATTDNLAGLDYYELFVDTVSQGSVVSSHVLDLSSYADGPHTIVVRAYDKAGNYTDSPAQTVNVDQTAPVISNIVALQDGSSVLCPDIAVQGMVDIYVDVTDDGCAALVVPPTVTVDGITPVNYLGVAGDTYHYQIEVTAGTTNSSHVITVEAEDDLGNSSSDSGSAVCVNKNQITGQVELEELADINREVTFVASGGLPAQWSLTLSFAGHVADYVLTDVPDGTTHLSAKADWNLQIKLAAAPDGDGQATAGFTGDDKLRGGDLNGTNTVNILDYAVLKANWFTSNSVADIDGNGQVNLADFLILKNNFFSRGD